MPCVHLVSDTRFLTYRLTDHIHAEFVFADHELGEQVRSINPTWERLQFQEGSISSGTCLVIDHHYVLSLCT